MISHITAYLLGVLTPFVCIVAVYRYDRRQARKRRKGG